MAKFFNYALQTFKTKLEKYEITLIFCFVGVLATLLIYVYVKYFPGEISQQHIRWAEFGTFFGGIFGALFSFTAVLILLRTLKVNKTELIETRRVLEKQSFETTYFQLLNQIDNEKDKLSYMHSEKKEIEFANDLMMTIIVNNTLDPNVLLENVRYKIDDFPSYIDENNSLLNLLKIVFTYLADNKKRKLASVIHIRLLANKFKDNYLIIFNCYVLSYLNDFEAIKAIEECSFYEYLEDHDNRHRLLSLLDKSLIRFHERNLMLNPSE